MSQSFRFAQTVVVAALLAAVVTTRHLQAADWPQFRGPERNSVVTHSPPLLDSFPKEGPKILWSSEPIPGGDKGGWSSVSVASGKAYVYVNANTQKKWRMITKDTLAAQGYAANMPADLVPKLDDARTSSERKALKDDKALNPWIDQWLAANITGELAPFKQAARDRLRKGPAAVRYDLLEKLVPIIDKKFDSDADYVKWLADNGFDKPAQAAVNYIAIPSGRDAQDFLYCLDAATGKTLWNTPFNAEWFGFPASSSPTIDDGKVYILGSAGAICCFDANSGKLLWQGPVAGKTSNHHSRASSVLVAQGLAVVTTEAGTYASFLADPQKIAWTIPNVSSEMASDTTWTHAGKTSFFLFSGALVNPADGNVIAKAKGGRYCAPTIVGDYAALPGPDATGITAYKLTPEKVEILWSTFYAPDEFASPLIDGDCVYAVGGGYSGPKGKAACIDLKSGKILWEEPLPLAQHSSPALADGKIFAIVGPELVVFKASPEKFQILGRADLGLEKWCSPAIAGTQLFLRTSTKIICVDLSKP